MMDIDEAEVGDNTGHVLIYTGNGLLVDDLREALIRWMRGDRGMALYHLDKAGFTGIEAVYNPALEVRP